VTLQIVLHPRGLEIRVRDEDGASADRRSGPGLGEPVQVGGRRILLMGRSWTTSPSAGLRAGRGSDDAETPPKRSSAGAHRPGVLYAPHLGSSRRRRRSGPPSRMAVMASRTLHRALAGGARGCRNCGPMPVLERRFADLRRPGAPISLAFSDLGPLGPLAPGLLNSAGGDVCHGRLGVAGPRRSHR
jgi:hypothetical protein